MSGALPIRSMIALVTLLVLSRPGHSGTGTLNYDDLVSSPGRKPALTTEQYDTANNLAAGAIRAGFTATPGVLGAAVAAPAIRSAALAAGGPLVPLLSRSLGFGIAGLAGSALLEKWSYGRVDWGPLLASAAGAALTIAILNPVAWPAVFYAGLFGGAAGQLALWGTREIIKGVESQRMSSVAPAVRRDP